MKFPAAPRGCRDVPIRPDWNMNATTDRKKTTHVSSVHPPFDPRIFQKECLSLAGAGYEVVLVVPHDKAEVREGVRLVPVQKSSSLLRRVFHSARRTVQSAAREGSDIYHLHDPELLLWARPLLRSGAAVVYDMHEDLPHQIQDKSWIPRVMRKPLGWLAGRMERVLLRGVSVVLAEESYARSRPWLRHSVEVLNFPRLELLPSPAATLAAPRTFRFGYIGAVTKGRGSLAVLEALGLVNAMRLDVDFRCVGKVLPGHRAELESRAAQLGLTRYAYLGYLPPREGWAKIADCDAGLAVLEPLPNYVTSYPTKMFEYMALGLPVIVSDFPLYARIIDRYRCGLTVDPTRPESIAEAMARLVRDPEEARSMGRRGRQAVLDVFNWAGEERKLLRFYAELRPRRGRAT